MKNLIKKIFTNAFYQLLAVYALFIILITCGFFHKFSLHFEIFAIVISVLGVFIISQKKAEKPTSKKLHYAIFITAFLLILAFRTIPYINNSVPLGYDAGIYKYAIEQFSEKGFSAEQWIKVELSPAFLYITFFLNLFFSSEFIITWLFIIFNLILGITIYFTAKEYFNEKTALIAFLFYALSSVQFKVFSFLYYKTILAIILMLWAFYFLKKEKRILFIAFAALTGAMHLQTFFILFISYLAFSVYNYKNWKSSLTNSIAILALASISYIGFFRYAVLPLIQPLAESFVSPGKTPGTFISFFSYIFLILPILPFSIIGFLALAKRKQFNIVFFWALINIIIVLCQFFFYNRFIIQLDIILIMLSAFGFSILIKEKKKFGCIILVFMLVALAFSTFNESKNAHSLMSKAELDFIKTLEQTEENASIIVLSKEYSPWILAYSKRKTIAPGLFNENKWSESQWNEFWKAKNKNETAFLMEIYQKPIYLYAGAKKFENECFSVNLSQDIYKIYKYIC